MSNENAGWPDADEVERRLTVTEVGVRQDVVRVAVTGELDMGTAAVLHRRLCEIRGARPAGRLELDLSALGFCDLTGLRALDALGRASSPAWCQVHIVAAGPSLDLLLDLCRMPRLLGYIPPSAHRDGAGL
ncbi:STAS domain-containing protein [Actinoplanes sp. NPDC023936]|uniref:STAS domain-containing protein n=1 Tax=Actinoplanes sp. NPDC023936 TaxID=3154910 RepID=UPI0034074A00